MDEDLVGYSPWSSKELTQLNNRTKQQQLLKEERKMLLRKPKKVEQRIG